ncbi:hypothetical protein ACJ41O_014840 [Fusarium nematophilum]
MRHRGKSVEKTAGLASRPSAEQDTAEEQSPKTLARDSQDRVEKKRQTDRIAQQKHRKRQREHIEQLEKQLKVIQQGGESEIAQLVAENAKLRDEIQQLYGLVDRLQEVVQLGTEIRSQFEARHKHHHPPPAQEWPMKPSSGPAELFGDDGATTELQATTLAAGEVVPAVDVPNSSTEQLLGDIDMILPEIAAGEDDNLGSSLGISIVSPKDSSSDNSLWSHGSGVHVLDPVTSWWLDPHHDTSGAGVERPLAASSYPDPAICEANLYTAEWGGFQPGDGASNRERGFQTLRTTPAGFKGLSLFPFHPCSKLPCFISPPPPRDAEMHRILNVARSQIHEIGPPTFTDFLLNNPKNTLSIELKVFTEPMRLMKKSSEFLAAYWILYLLFRWQAALDEKSYHALPTWLRPTPLQLEVEHHAVLDQVPWPDLREELIRLSVSDMNKAFEAMKDIGKHLVVDFQASQALLNGDMGQLQSSILDLSRWKLENEFFRKHPQWWWLEARQ